MRLFTDLMVWLHGFAAGLIVLSVVLGFYVVTVGLRALSDRWFDR